MQLYISCQAVGVRLQPLLHLFEMKKNDVDYKIAMLVVNSYWRVADRVAKLKELGYTVSSKWVKSGGIGTIRRFGKSDGVQVSSAIGGNNHVGKAFVAFKNN